MPPSITESMISPHRNHNNLPSPPQKRGKEKGRRSSNGYKNKGSSLGHAHGGGSGGIGGLNRSIYCPRTETTYEGEICVNTPPNHKPHKTTMNHTSPSSSSSSLSSSSFPFFIKHGKGTIHNHRDNTTLVGFFQNNQIVGHALQTFYDGKGICAIAQYEGSFTTSTSETTRNATTSGTSPRAIDTSEPINNNDDGGDGVPNQMPDRTLLFSNNYTRHGFGKYSWPLTGDEYVGEFHGGAMQGKGTFTWGSTGDRYEGHWYKGRMHGEDGKKLTASGDEFIGTFTKGRATGWGIKNFACGDVHNGMYRKDKRHGFGSYKWQNGDQYVGQWQYGRMFGRGIKCLVFTRERQSIMSQVNNDNTFQRGDLTEIFHGTLVNDKAQGYGVKYYACGDMYHGQYENDMRHGYGVYTWSHGGEKYSGQWVNGRMCGVGMKSMANGDTYDGEFLDDEAHGFGVKIFGSTGDIHYGEYQCNLRHGNGLYRWSNGNEYDGHYVKGEQCGLGCYSWNNGAMTFDGQWHKGQKHGPGFFRVLLGDQRNDGSMSEQVFFEVWSKGNRLFRQVLNCTWNNLPGIDTLPQFHTWRHVWDNTKSSDYQNGATIIRSSTATVPMLEDANSTLIPFDDDIRHVTFAETMDPPEDVPVRRHYSVDFYPSSLLDEVKSCGKPRSSSLSSYVSSATVTNLQYRKGPRCCIRKDHFCKGGFVVVSGFRKKIRISRF